MDLIKFSTHYYNSFPQTQTHTQLGTREYISFPYINLLASEKAVKKLNTFTVSYIYVMELLHIYVVIFSPISDTSPLLSWINNKNVPSISCQHWIWSQSFILSKLYLKVHLGYNVLATFLQFLSTLLDFLHYPKS